MLIIIKLEQASRRILEVCFEFSAAMLRKACFNLYARTFADAKFASGPSRGGAARPKVGPASLDDKKAASRDWCSCTMPHVQKLQGSGYQCNFKTAEPRAMQKRPAWTCPRRIFSRKIVIIQRAELAGQLANTSAGTGSCQVRTAA